VSPTVTHTLAPLRSSIRSRSRNRTQERGESREGRGSREPSPNQVAALNAAARYRDCTSRPARSGHLSPDDPSPTQCAVLIRKEAPSSLPRLARTLLQRCTPEET